MIPGERLTATVILNPTSDPFLAQHRFKQRPLLPLVVSLEALAEAACVLCGGDQVVVGLDDVTPVKTLQFFSDRPLTAKIHAEARGGRVRCQLTCDFHNRRGQLVIKDQMHVHAAIRLSQGPQPPSLSPPGKPDTWAGTWFADREAILHHGPALCNLPKIFLDEAGGWGEVVAPPLCDLAHDRPGNRWVLPPAALDACLMACGIYIWVNCDRRIAIPAGIRSLRLGRLPRTGEVCSVYFSFLGRQCNVPQAEIACFDFTLFGDDDTVILHAEGYRSMILSGNYP
jgi:hypothetical protein